MNYKKSKDILNLVEESIVSNTVSIAKSIKKDLYGHTVIGSVMSLSSVAKMYYHRFRKRGMERKKALKLAKQKASKYKKRSDVNTILR